MASYVLHVVSASITSWDSLSLLNKAPNPYVEVLLLNRVQRTRTVKRQLLPVWNEKLILRDINPSTPLWVRLKHESSNPISKDRGIADVKISVEELLKKSADGNATLSMSIPDPVTAKTVVTTITVRVSIQDSTLIGGTAIENARQDAAPLQRSADLADSKVVQAADYLVADVTDDNPFLKALSQLISSLDSLAKIVDEAAKVHPYVNFAWRVTSSLYNAIKGQLERDKQLIALVKSMEDAYSFVKEARDLPNKVTHLEEAIQQLVTQTVESAIFIKEYTGHGFGGRLMRQTLSSDASTNMTDMTKRFVDLKAAVTSGVALHSAIITCRVLTVSENIERMEYLKYLNHTKMDASLRQSCLANTRKQILSYVTDWLTNPSEQNILWLYGLAGSGKSTIATTIAEHFGSLGRLGAFLFFSRNDAAQSDPAGVIRTMAYQLAQRNIYVREAICKAVELNPGIADSSLRIQFSTLILEPLRSVSAAHAQGPTVVIMDAMDECGTKVSRKPLLALISQELEKLPAMFRFLITSREEIDICTALSNKPHVHQKQVTAGTELDLSDVRTYICQHLCDLRVDESIALPPDWPMPSMIEALVQRSAGLFIWAATAVRFIAGGRRPAAQVDILLQSQLRHRAESALDEIYSVALEVAGDWESEDDKDDYCAVLGAIVVARIPLSDTTLDRILGLSGDRSSAYILKRLNCLLAWSKGQPAHILHASFADYLSSQGRCGSRPWYIDVTAYDALLVRASFRIMKDLLRFNICGLESSHVRNKDLPDLFSRIQEHIPPELSYSCRFWADHLTDSPAGGDLLANVQHFLFECLLAWLEVASLTQEVAKGIKSLTAATLWLSSIDHDTAKCATDAKRFLTQFRKPISESAPHIYLTALSFSPNDAPLVQRFLPQYLNTINTRDGTSCQWPMELLVLEGHYQYVLSVAFSPDGTRIASGSFDRTVRVWDAETGELVLEPLQGHEAAIASVVYTPDGKRIISASWDETLRVWDAETGKMILRPFHGHTASVWSMAISPDGKRIASGSVDETVLVWDAETGTIIAGPFRGHGCKITSVAFSPDGNWIASLSQDGIIRVRIAETGELVFTRPREADVKSTEINSIAFSPDGKLLATGSPDGNVRVWNVETWAEQAVSGDLGVVTSVAYSPDSKRIASGWFDGTVRVWDAVTGQMVSGPLLGHTAPVFTVAFSKDGKRILSGSEDATVRVWDAETNVAAATPALVYGGMILINSVVFSPDGKRIAAASQYEVLHVWDAETGVAVPGQFQGQTDGINSLAFSPDGKRIVSGSEDKTIRIWHTLTGEIVGEPFCGHENAVTSVDFSPDGRRIASGSRDRTIRVWDTETGQEVSAPLHGHTRAVTSVAFSTNGARIVSGSEDETVRLWDVEGAVAFLGPLKGHMNVVTSVAFSSDATRIVSGSADGGIRVWDADTGMTVSGPFYGHAEWLNSVAFSPDGKRIASASFDQTVRLWDAETGEVLGILHGHTDRVTSVAFSPDGKRLVSGSWDQTVRVWDGTIGLPLQRSPEERSGPADPEIEAHQLYRSQANDVGYHDSCMLQDGWMLGPNSELLFWVPQHLRPGFWRPSNTLVIGRNVTRPDFSRFRHGLDWTRCRTVSPQSFNKLPDSPSQFALTQGKKVGGIPTRWNSL